jgi:type VI secretion system FHA domain protein
MSIEITIVKSPGNVRNTKPSHIFAEQGGTIGRGPGNAWIVEDPEKFISSKHSQILFENGHYYLSDLSTNGTFFNGSREPIGSGNRIALKDGDRFTLGDYEFLVSMQNNNPAAAATYNDPFGPGTYAGGDAGSDQGLFGVGGGDLNDPFADTSGGFAPSIMPMLTPGQAETDPLVALDKASRIPSQTPFPDARSLGSQRDDADPLQQAVNWPNAIPENWDADEDLMADRPARPRPVQPAPAPVVDPQLPGQLQLAEQRCAALENENQKLLAHVVALKQQLKELADKTASPAPAQGVMAVDTSLIEAMGLSKWNLSEQKKAEISQVVGELVRETMMGLMQALSFRKKIKEEFRINVTTIQPVENNPLKFSANIEDALENMFIKDNKAYQKPLDAVREGFHGISEHQLAVLAGIQAAFRGMLERLDPDSLEQRFEKYRKAGVLKVGQKGKNWDSYKEFHQDLVNNIDNSFQHLFGYDFVQAYEDQLQKLLMARKAKASAKDSTKD